MPRGGEPLIGDHPRRCTATSQTTGERCRRYAIQGGHVCPHHGGNAPQVRAAANRRLADLVPDAVAGLKRALDDPGDIKAVVKAAQVVLDRTGHGPTSRIELEARAGEELRLQADGIMATVQGALDILGVDIEDGAVRDAVRDSLQAVAQGFERGHRPAALPAPRATVDIHDTTEGAQSVAYDVLDGEVVR